MARAHVVHVEHDKLLRVNKDSSSNEWCDFSEALLATLLGCARAKDSAFLAEYGVIHVGSTEATAPPPSPDAIAPPLTPQEGLDVEPGPGGAS